MTNQEVEAIVDQFFGDRLVINWEFAYKLGKLIADREAELWLKSVGTKLPKG